MLRDHIGLKDTLRKRKNQRKLVLLFNDCTDEACVSDGDFSDFEIFFDFTVRAFAVRIFFDTESNEDFIAVDRLSVGNDGELPLIGKLPFHEGAGNGFCECKITTTDVPELCCDGTVF